MRAKYVNSPEGELFRKGDLLYGLHAARNAIAKQGRAVVVEGNTDVLALRQAGVEPVVASMGTALTERHVRELGRLTRIVYLCFDADAAGEAATLRGMELAHGEGLDVRVVGAPARHRPGGRRGGVRRSAPARRAVSALPRAPDDRARGEPAGRVRPGGRDAERRPRLARAPGGHEAGNEPPPPAPRVAERAGAVRGNAGVLRPCPGRSCRRATGSSVCSWPPACSIPPRPRRTCTSSATSTSTRPSIGGCARTSPARARRSRPPRCAPSSGQPPSRRASPPTAPAASALELKKRWVERQIAALEHREMTRDDERRHADLVRFRGELRDAVEALA